MCGIVGVIGNNQAKDILLTGLEKLEYRGYDSAGIMVADDTEAYLVKAPGRVSELKALANNIPEGHIGIGHTRWATHGVPNTENAHPHQSTSGKFCLVHNGVIENYLELKNDYLTDIALKGDTDSEIVVELVDYFYRQGKTPFEAFKAALDKVEGSYAIALMDVEDSNTLYLAKNKSPLLIGLGENCHYVGSDAMAMINETNEFVEIKDGERIILTPGELTIFDRESNKLSRESFVADIDATDTEKGLYPHYMLKEIDEQPSVMRKLISEYLTEDGKTTIDEDIISHMASSDRIYIVGCGTSWHAGLVGKKIIEELTHIPVEVHLASEMGYDMPILSEKPFFIFLTQSGETADSRQVLVKVNELNLPSLTITNVKGSTLSREATYTLLLHAGPEIAVASTKAYTSQIAVMAYLAQSIGLKKGLEKASSIDLAHEMAIIASVMDSMISEKELIAGLSESLLGTTRNAFFIGRGLDYAVSMEAALKLKEISYIQAEGFAAGELKHGTIALIEEGTPVISIITDEKTASHTRGNAKEVESRGANVLTISLENVAHEGDELVLLPVHELLTPLVSVVPLQLLAYYASLQRGLDVDKPRNLAKSVTVE
ncbi:MULTISPECIES: glutamine--fructose-6-phosphate transaminase (isomerizing) [unclassified Vagococcus]|uniref:glutamine--fructose-6-phosphate transaminase (isomerizing) n=1 Tax=unclassified Vagococcus TaxID=2648499 RepID=UPI001F50A906|nr:MULTISPECIES: glutamine--fructose-6-phosphate transaminase (isomerizing) [unclassified Vagococcus]MCI0129863.1 glutamine--fructose-6-phosphate transaminase (isomerizing) [Vagococcus sp. CY53-2]UNM88714.1 glutamine--fructose-6-phosphate transaminase (isomerizing) [Vagococcus sp. CY52-2]